MPIHASSLDFDGCLYTDHTRPYLLIDFVKRNRNLLEHITHSYEGAEKIILVGSLRQTTEVDAHNASIHQSGSCYLAMEHISRHLNIEFDRFTLSDIYLGQDPGYSVNAFFCAVAKLGLQDNAVLTSEQFDKLRTDKAFLDENGHQDLIAVNEVDSKVIFSCDKVNIIYAQMHKIASKKPKDEIIFDFYDDLDAILNVLGRFFSTFPSLIPSNVTLRLFRYTSKGYTLPEEIHAGIKGIGEVDETYYQTVINMGEIAEENEPFNSTREYTFAEYITPEGLEAKAKTQKEQGPNAQAVTTLTSEQSRAMAMASAINDFAENNPNVRVGLYKRSMRNGHNFGTPIIFNATLGLYNPKANTGEMLIKSTAEQVFKMKTYYIVLTFSLESDDLGSEGFFEMKPQAIELTDLNQSGSYAGAILSLLSALGQHYPAKMAPADVVSASLALDGLVVKDQIAAGVQAFGMFPPATNSEATDKPQASTLELPESAPAIT